MESITKSSYGTQEDESLQLCLSNNQPNRYTSVTQVKEDPNAQAEGGSWDKIPTAVNQHSSIDFVYRHCQFTPTVDLAPNGQGKHKALKQILRGLF